MRVSLLSLASVAVLCCATALSAPVLGVSAYNLHATYDARNWRSSFTFWTADDPTHGFVDFISADEAEVAGMFELNSNTNQVYMGVDHTNVISTNSRGRKSIRIQSNEQFNAGTLVILDAEHIPKQICGSWPAFWSCGPNWPQGGEIDVIEGANAQNYDVMSLHLEPGCTVNQDGVKPGTKLVRSNCDSKSNGCSSRNSDPATYGSGFNANGGGVYAYDWTSTHVAIWSWPRSAIPADIRAGNPNPSSWGAPNGVFKGCDFSKFIYNHWIIFDTVFCGDWAGNTFAAECPQFGTSCKNYVANNPKVFEELYWIINSLKVYKQSADAVAAHVNGTSQAELQKAPEAAKHDFHFIQDA